MMNGCFPDNPRLALSQCVRMNRWNQSVEHHTSRIDSVFRIIDFVGDFLSQKEQTNVVWLAVCLLVVQSYFQLIPLFLRLMRIGIAWQVVVVHPEQKTNFNLHLYEQDIRKFNQLMKFNLRS